MTFKSFLQNIGVRDKRSGLSIEMTFKSFLQNIGIRDKEEWGINRNDF